MVMITRSRRKEPSADDAVGLLAHDGNKKKNNHGDVVVRRHRDGRFIQSESAVMEKTKKKSAMLVEILKLMVSVGGIYGAVHYPRTVSGNAVDEEI